MINECKINILEFITEETTTNMVSFETLAIFILATTTPNGRFQQDFRTYYESRLLPIQETWGSLFPNIVHVFGTNAFDHDFLIKRCHSLDHRRLIPHTRQIPIKHEYSLYDCPIYQKDFYELHENNVTNYHSNYNIHFINKDDIVLNMKVLWVGNCTGEYFGSGPTCRCQESMRYFLNSYQYKIINWFAFIDDDIYFRPFGVLRMLKDIENNRTMMNKPLALVPAKKYYSFTFSQAKIDVNGTLRRHNCSGEEAYSYAFAQPVIMNRLAVQQLESALVGNGFLEQQKLWGGSHDAILGMILWMYQIPTYSFSSAYHGADIFVDFDTKILKRHRYKPSKHIIFHRILNFKGYVWDKQKKMPKLKAQRPSQYDIAQLTKDDILFKNPNFSPMNQKMGININKTDIIKEQELAGSLSAKDLVKLKSGGVQNTIFGDRAKTIVDHFTPFMPVDCLVTKRKVISL